MHPALGRSAACLLLLVLLSACAGLSPSAHENTEAALQHEALADLQLQAGRADLAASDYALALALSPGNAGLSLKLGRTMLRLDQPGPALDAFRKAQAGAPDSPAALAGAGEALYRLGRQDEAGQALRQALALSPGSWRSHCLLGLVLEASGQPEQAAAEYQAALALPGSAKARPELLNNLGVAQALSGDAEAGVRTLRSALAAGSAPERVSNNLGLFLVRLGRYDEALAAFRLSGDDPRALNNMGYALLLKGEAQTAQVLFEKALQASPEFYGTADGNLARAHLAASPGVELVPLQHPR